MRLKFNVGWDERQQLPIYRLNSLSSCTNLLYSASLFMLLVFMNTIACLSFMSSLFLYLFFRMEVKSRLDCFLSPGSAAAAATEGCRLEAFVS